jgi:hypothetical protein
MKNLRVKNLVTKGIIVMLCGIFSSGYSQKKSNETLPNGSVKLEYKYPAGKTIKYLTDTKIVQDMDVNGQSMLVNIARGMGCEVTASGNVAENVKLEIKVDSLFQNIESPQGTAGGPINDVKGKTFSVVISPSGKIVDLSEAAKIVYTVEGSGDANLSQEFANYFPTLPSSAVKPGDVWATSDSINTKTETNDIRMPLESSYKFEGIENVDGVDCAKISATLSGTRKQITKSQGMEIHISGPFTGTQTMLFAVKDGYFVKESVTTKLTGNIEIPDQNMSFPVVMTVTSTNEAVK